jgi:hypothetical protein
MPIHVEWGNTEQTVLNFTFVSPWTWDEFYEMQNQVTALCSGITYVVDAIADVSAGRALPPNALTHLSKAAAKIPPDQGVLTAVGIDSFMRNMIDMALAKSPHLRGRLKLVDSLDEAYATIAEIQAERGSIV